MLIATRIRGHERMKYNVLNGKQHSVAERTPFLKQVSAELNHQWKPNSWVYQPL